MSVPALELSGLKKRFGKAEIIRGIDLSIGKSERHAIIGPNGAGKSTLFNRATGADVLAKDMLFATLDPTMRSIELPSGHEIILSDTVGFISDLPTQLVAAFRATLEEVLDADLILHVRDISHEETEGQARNVRDILSELGVSDEAPMLEVWNKIDLLDAGDREAMTLKAERAENVIAISALDGFGFDTLFEQVAELVDDPTVTKTILVPFADGKKRAWLFAEGIVDAEETDENGYNLTITWTQKQAAKFARL